HQKYYRSVGIETYRDDFLQRFYLDHVLRKPDLALILEDLKTEKVVGLLLARKGILQFSPESIGREEFWWIEKPYRTFKNARLMVDSFHNWIRLNECKHSSLSHMGDPRIAKWYSRMGYKISEAHHLKTWQHN